MKVKDPLGEHLGLSRRPINTLEWMVSEDALSLSYETGEVWVLSSCWWPSFSSLKAWSPLAPTCCSCWLQALSVSYLITLTLVTYFLRSICSFQRKLEVRLSVRGRLFLSTIGRGLPKPVKPIGEQGDCWCIRGALPEGRTLCSVCRHEPGVAFLVSGLLPLSSL